MSVLISDPDYAVAFTVIRKVFSDYGYNVMLHGTATKDLDILAVPWVENCDKDPRAIVQHICELLKLTPLGPIGVKPHGRRVWTLVMNKFFGDPRYIDLGIMPTDGERT